MKLIINQDCSYKSNEFKKGQQVEAGSTLSKYLLKWELADEGEFVTLQDEMVEEIQAEQTEEFDYNMPAKDLVKEIPNIGSIEILEELKKDSRKTVSEAAKKRIKSLSI